MKRSACLAILKAPLRRPKNVTLQLRVSVHVKARLAQYVEFLKCRESYVVSEALKLVFDRDKEFKEWTEKQLANGPEAQREQPAILVYPKDRCGCQSHSP
jgi:hypothetical protein